MASTKQMLLDHWSPPMKAAHYALDHSSEEFERRRKKYNVCVIMVILSGRCLSICSLLGEDRLLKYC